MANKIDVFLADKNGAVATVEPRTQTPSGNAINVQIGPGDVISNIPVIMDFEHHQVHEGESFKATNKQSSLGTNTVKYAIVVPTFSPTINGPHMVVTADIYNGAALVDIYEGATYTGGAGISSYNRNRNSGTVPMTGITGSVTSTTGTLIDSFYAGAGIREAGANRQQSEWVLKSNTTYRVDVIGQVAGTAGIIGFLWYEDLGV